MGNHRHGVMLNKAIETIRERITLHVTLPCSVSRVCFSGTGTTIGGVRGPGCFFVFVFVFVFLGAKIIIKAFRACISLIKMLQTLL